MDLGRLALRGVVGPLMVGHGTQKLFGWFGGHGPDATGGAFESMGLRPGKRHATSAGIAETTGGALLTLGALTPVATAAITGVMVTAIRKAHIKNGPWVSNGGFEYNLALIALSAALTETGPGRPSVDAARFPNLHGSGYALLAVAAGAAGAYLATDKLGQPASGPQEAQVTEAPSDPAVEDGRRFTREGAPAASGQSA